MMIHSLFEQMKCITTTRFKSIQMEKSGKTKTKHTNRQKIKKKKEMKQMKNGQDKRCDVN